MMVAAEAAASRSQIQSGQEELDTLPYHGVSGSWTIGGYVVSFFHGLHVPRVHRGHVGRPGVLAHQRCALHNGGPLEARPGNYDGGDDDGERRHNGHHEVRPVVKRHLVVNQRRKRTTV